ncbi:PEP/pyruvate-binding domain-containing protein [Marinicellulosiphila megalodicopiae]|uniref:PEP/pyruvate-binding domain-containing protein n=1 Tax=Marinicellulosiphila megalodicopiae TaxID=2724896 RepID=UPI003BB1CCED
MKFYTPLLFILLSFIVTSCDVEKKTPQTETGITIEPGDLIITEAVSKNDGILVDVDGQTPDWIEIQNISDFEINLIDFYIADKTDEYLSLSNNKDVLLQPNEVIVMIADKSNKTGHLPFKLSSSGETLYLYDANKLLIDLINIPALDPDHAYARFALGFEICRYTTPSKVNPSQCESSNLNPIKETVTFEPFDNTLWPLTLPLDLAINEMALFPANFIEVKNFSTSSVNLSDYQISIKADSPNAPQINTLTNLTITLPNVVLNSMDVYSIPLTDTQLNHINNHPDREALIMLTNTITNHTETIAFMSWPDHAALTRQLNNEHSFQFCTNTTQNLENQCNILEKRTLTTRARGLYTPADFKTLALGGSKQDIASAKFVIDLNNNRKHFLSAEHWPLHYSFVREVIEKKPVLNRCLESDNDLFNYGWGVFSYENYFNAINRDYHLGTLSNHSNANMKAVEFTYGDAITATQMQSVFFDITSGFIDVLDWSLRVQDDTQIEKAKLVDGQLPILSPNAPFANLQQQNLSSGISYGTLKFIPTSELQTTALNFRDIVITQDVPNNIAFIGGLITESFQTPLAHVNLLSQSRSTPNLALPNASNIEPFKSLLNQLVRFEVSADGYTITQVELAEAQLFWESKNQNKPILTPRTDFTNIELTDLIDANFSDLPSIGAKAAQFAELYNVDSFNTVTSCGTDIHFDVPEQAFAIPIYYYQQHFINSGAQDFLNDLFLDAEFLDDAAIRALKLKELQNILLNYPVDSTFLTDVEQIVFNKYGESKVRFRSSSNTEDLAEFNGAGLYHSLSAQIGDKDATIENALKTVWASLWNVRAYEERQYANIDQSAVAMGILVHQSYPNEIANGVAVARNILDPTRGDQYYINSQFGEASVTNPSPSVFSEQLIFLINSNRPPRIRYQSNSSLTDDLVLTEEEVEDVACSLNAIQNHFKPIIDPDDTSRFFTMEMEFKYLNDSDKLIIKQARPYHFGSLDIPDDCREF